MQVKSIIFNLLLTSAVMISGYNIWKTTGVLGGKVSRGLEENIKNNKKFTYDRSWNAELIRLAQKHVLNKKTCFVWTTPVFRKEIATETKVFELNYYLYPSKIYYMNNGKIGLCDFVICEQALRTHFERTAKAMNLDNKFKIVGENDVTCIYQQK